MNIHRIYRDAAAFFAEPRPNLLQHDNSDIGFEDICWQPEAVAARPTVAVDLPIYPSAQDLFVEVHE